MITENELQEIVEKISLEFFHAPFRHQAVFNSRLRSSGGRYHLTDHHLDFNPRLLTIHGMDAFIGVIKHELCHYHLHINGKGFQHKDKDFKELLKKTGGSRFAPQSLEKKESPINVKGVVFSIKGEEKLI